jgi:hypothetical protein
MNNTNIFKTLYENISIFQTLIQHIDNQQARWKPAEGKWSVLEVVNHLYDEEREDFRSRLDVILSTSDENFSPVDPESWVVERKYNERDLSESLHNFIEERKKSVAWLNELKDPNWDRVYVHPKIGDIHAGDMLAAWLAHDFMHMRQIVKLHLEYHIREAQPYSIKYAAP